MNDFLKDPYPPRCRTKEDAVAALEAINDGKSASHLLVLFWIEEYDNCQFEIEIQPV